MNSEIINGIKIYAPKSKNEFLNKIKEEPHKKTTRTTPKKRTSNTIKTCDPI